MPWVAYHIIWDDDIDFPDDNDPSDHEVVWVQFNKERSRLVNYYTYFHGRVMAAPPLALAQAAASGGRPSVVVQWGKHGTMPLYWQPLTIVADMADIEHNFYPIGKAITLETYNRGIYEKLKTLGPRGRESPLAKGWPRKFNGTCEEFTDFSKVFDSATMLRKKRIWEVTCFGMAVMNRHFLRYNVRAKIEWPEALCSDP